MATDNLKTAFRISIGGLTKTFQEFNMAAPKATTASKNIILQQQNISQFKSEDVSKYTQEKICAEVSF